jgi:hypothetical protein
MTKQSKLGLVLVCALAGTVILLGGSPAASQRQVRPPVVRQSVAQERRPEEQPQDPFADVAVLVELFVVQVDLSAFEEMGVSPLGQEPHTVSADNILECLKDPDKATILTGAKAVSVHRSQQGQMRQSETTYRPRTRAINTDQGPRNTAEYRAYETGQTFQVQPTILSEDTILLHYDFSYAGVRGEQQSSDAAPPDTISWSWNGPASVTAGAPTIVGATQGESSAVFLILTAHIMDRG